MKCAICGGRMKVGRTTVTIDSDDAGLLVIRGVTARICDQCGEEWLSDNTAAQVETVFQRAKRQKTEFEVVAMA